MRYTEIIQQVLLAIVTILILTGVSKLIPYLRKQNELTDNTIVKGLVDELLNIVETAVGFYNQRAVIEMKANNKFTIEEQKKVNQQVWEDVMNHLNDESYKKLNDYFNKDLDKFVDQAIENEVLKQKSKVDFEIDRRNQEIISLDNLKNKCYNDSGLNHDSQN